jgi:DNA topoisomerase IB
MMDLAARVAARYKGKKKVPSEDGGTTTVYEYSDQQVSRRNNEKAKRLEKLRASIGKLRAQVAKDLSSTSPEKQLTALVVALIDETFERVGNDQSAKDGHFGVTGWTKSHVKMTQGKATITYVGKSGVKQKKTVKGPALKALRDAFARCEGEDCLFDYDGGSVDATKVNAYLKKFKVTAKDLRGFHANEEMRKALKAARKGKLPSDPKKRKEKLKGEWDKALETAAGAVGHEASTLKSQYLVPGLEDNFLKDGTVMEKLDKKASAESVAARFVQAKLSTAPKAKRSKCMECKAKPTVAYHWADGRGIAWFCDKCGEKWKKDEDRDIVKTIKIEDGVMPTKIAWGL